MSGSAMDLSDDKVMQLLAQAGCSFIFSGLRSMVSGWPGAPASHTVDER